MIPAGELAQLRAEFERRERKRHWLNGGRR